MGELTTRLPWEPAPVAEKTADEKIAALMNDFAFAVAYTAVRVHSNRQELQTCVNTQRGQIVPRGECFFTDGTKVEFQDIGMPQPGSPMMTVPELLVHVYGVASGLGLEFK